jgi:putative flippase GtrA
VTARRSLSSLFRSSLGEKFWMSPTAKHGMELTNSALVNAVVMKFLIRLLNDDRSSILRYFLAGVAVSLGYTITVIVFVEWLKWFGPTWASTVSFLLWTPISYVAHREFTFRFDHQHRAALLKYAISYLLRLLASALVVVTAVDYLHLHYVVGVLMNWIVLPMIGYFVLKLWVFAVPDSSEAPLRSEVSSIASEPAVRMRRHADRL